MIVTKEIPAVRKHRSERLGKTCGFVPTMGFLHDGHLSLVRRALEENDDCIVSIYVNSLQFNNADDFDNYPQDMERDLSLLREAGVGLVFTPDQDIMYSAGFSSKVKVHGLSDTLEGVSRPGHFGGVSTVVTKLFNIVEPNRAYFGQKDAQQLLIIKKMVEDLNFNLRIVGCPTYREKDGLAMSSRNSRLTPEQRSKAPIVYKSLQLAEKRILQGETDPKKVISAMQELIHTEPLAKIDLLSINEAKTLDEIDHIRGDILISLAVNLGKVRLIDNIGLSL
ncbi:MAG: pantoate--beta-alanine ligase [Proteobacteria bacterium]|nr:pantoate--beta-alanine ligase [Pseudomonadota bacterium]